MKNILLFITLLCPALVLAQSVTDQSHNREDDGHFKREREQWIENMHRASPDIRWQTIEAENSLVNAANVLSMRQSQKSPTLQADTFAGLVRGRWSERGSFNQAGRTHTADYNPATGEVLLASAGGILWRGDLTSSVWTPLNDERRFNDIRDVRRVQVGNTSRIVVVKNSPAQVYFSDDNGAHWDTSRGLKAITGWGSFRKAAYIQSTQTIVIVGSEWDYKAWKQTTVVYGSTDGGFSFQNLGYYAPDNNLCDVWSPQSNAPVAYLLRSDSLFLYAEDLTYSYVGKFAPTIEYDYVVLGGQHSAGRPLSATVLYAYARKGNSRELLRSSNGGATWETRGTVPTNTFSQGSFAVSPANPNVLFIAGVDCYRSYDGGATWTKVNGWGEYYGNPAEKLHADVPGIQTFFEKDGQPVHFVHTDGGSYISRDSLLTVTNITLRDLRVGQYYGCYTQPTNPFAVSVGSQDQGFQYCARDSGGILSFEQTVGGDYGHLCSGDEGKSVWSVYPGFAMLYPNISASKQTVRWDFSFKNNLWIPPTIADPEFPGRCHIAGGGDSVGDGAYIYTLTVTGNKATPEKGKFDFSRGNKDRRIGALAISPDDPCLRYTATNDGLFFTSTNCGQSWTQADSFAGPGGHYFYGSTILPSPSNPRRVWVGGSGYSNPAVFVSNDLGATFTRADSGLPKTLVYRLASTPDERFLFAATEAGPYIYNSATKQWYSLRSKGAPDQTYWWVEFIPELRTARFVTYGRGIWDFTLDDDGVVSVATAESIPAPQLSVAPNPVGDEATVTLLNPIPTNVDVNVYARDGRLVSQLFSGLMEHGETRLSFRREVFGNRLPAGMYIVTARSRYGMQFVKLLLE